MHGPSPENLYAALRDFPTLPQGEGHARNKNASPGDSREAQQFSMTTLCPFRREAICVCAEWLFSCGTLGLKQPQFQKLDPMTSQRLPLIGQTQELFPLDALSLVGLHTQFAGGRKIFKVFSHGAHPPR